MASNTENLNLLMKNPSTDGADTFNVDTMLNENWRKIDNNAGTVAQTLANILKPTTPPIIGLPPSTTPDGMFRALGNTGELHVWRKTTISQQAGYNLGNIVRGTFWLVSGSDQYVDYQVSASLDVSSDGTIALHSPNTVTINMSDSASAADSALKGKFVKRTGQVSWGIPQTIVFIPNSANITKTDQIRTDSYQEVSGYPAGTTTTYPVSTNPNAYQEGDDAIPAGTTIEYLGKLGDKARVQVVSYVGTDTYGESNPNSLTFDFVPKIIFWVGVFPSGFRTYAFPEKLSTDYSQNNAIGSGVNGYRYTKVSNDKKTIMWYHTSSYIYQLNGSGSLYAVIAIG